MNLRKAKTKYFILFFTTILMLGCKKEFNVEFTVENSSQRKLQINFQKTNESQIDSNEISLGQSLIFLIEMGDGQTTENYLETISEIPIDFIEIKDLEENLPSCQPMSFDCWKKKFPSEKNGVGTVFIELSEFSFQ